MIISHAYKFVFLDVPKTASLSLDTVFEKQYGGKLVKPPPESKLGEKHSRVIPLAGADYLKVTCVRDPYSRMVSFWHHTRNTQQQEIRRLKLTGFDSFLDHCLMVTDKYPADHTNGFDYRYFSMWKYLEPTGYDTVMRLESLESDFNKLPFVTTPVQLPNRNKTNNGETWQELQTPERTEKINAWAGKDFEVFGYTRL